MGTASLATIGVMAVIFTVLALWQVFIVIKLMSVRIGKPLDSITREQLDAEDTAVMKFGLLAFAVVAYCAILFSAKMILLFGVVIVIVVIGYSTGLSRYPNSASNARKK